MLICGELSPSPLHLDFELKSFPHHSQKSFEQWTEMTFDRRLVSINGPVVRGLYYPPQNLTKRTCVKIFEIVKAIA